MPGAPPPAALCALFAAILAGCGNGAPNRPAEPPEGPPLAEAAVPEPEPAAVAAAPVDSPDAAPVDDGVEAEPKLPMLLEFTRDHCLPCKLMAPWTAELREKYAGRVLIREINIDRPENRDLGAFFKARSIPTQVYVDAEGREVGRHVGLATRAQMERSLARYGFTADPSGR